jgi:hypothetical protein
MFSSKTFEVFIKRFALLPVSSRIRQLQGSQYCEHATDWMTEDSGFDFRQGQEMLLFSTASKQTEWKCFGKNKFHISNCLSPRIFISSVSQCALKHSAIVNGDSAIFSCQKAFAKKSRIGKKANDNDDLYTNPRKYLVRFSAGLPKIRDLPQCIQAMNVKALPSNMPRLSPSKFLPIPLTHLFFMSLSGVRMSSLGMLATIWPIVPAPGNRSSMQQSLKREPAGKTDVLGENLPQCHSGYHKPHMT